ncbi:MAG: hypothetical protein ACPGFB_11775 [Verrucomicrobiales bacterium]
MEGHPKKKWKTLRKIGSPQGESEGTVPANKEEIVRTELPPSIMEGLAEVEKTELVVPPPASKLETILDDEPVRVLVAHPVGSTARLMRETLENFTSAEVETTSNFLRAFELALQKRYEMFFFGMRIGDLDGPLLYELISKAYACGTGLRKLAPAVVFVREKDDPKLPEELERDVRVKDVVSKPIRIDRLLKAVESIVEVRDPTAG